MAELRTCGGTCGSNAPVLIAACSGRSNVGQIANQVMVKIDKMGIARSFCIAGIGAGLPGFLEGARTGRLIMIDGCPMQCGKKILEKYEVEPFRYFLVTDLGIKKVDVLGELDPDVKKVISDVLCNI
ncbi:MAG: putative zinc-binding protein [Syntrophorhabdaceae bacterium]